MIKIRSLSHAEVNRGVLSAVTFCGSGVNDDKNSFTFSRDGAKWLVGCGY